MKNRIVYPQLWLDEKFADCAVPTKLLFMYLITNIQLGLSPYLHINDRQIMFDTGLTVNQLETGKKDLSNLKWVFFTNNWVFHNHKCSYINYDGQKNVIIAKEKEIETVPVKVRNYFKGLISGKEQVLNPAITIIRNNNHNNKLIGVVKGNSLEDIKDSDIEEIATAYKVPVSFVNLQFEQLKNYCASKGKRYTDYKAALRNFVIKDAQRMAESQRTQKGGVYDATNV